MHVRLLQLASQQGCRQVAIAPCCYNRIQGSTYQALSTTARQSSLQLSQADLGLPLNEAVTSSARVRRQRDASMARRLGFDLLQREQRGVDDYLSTPSLAISWLEKPFAQYCRDLAALRQVSVSGEPDWTALEAAGWQRLAAVRNLELVRNLFRRPWKCGWYWTAPCSSRSKAMRCMSVCSATTPDPAQLAGTGRARRIAAEPLKTCG